MDLEHTKERGEAAVAEEAEVEKDLRRDRARRLLRALGSGVVGAAALTAAHEGLRRFRWGAPRLDRVGQRGLSRLVRKAGGRPPRGLARYGAALAGDLAVNGLTYGLFLSGMPAHPWKRGLISGTAVGATMNWLPSLLGIRRPRAMRRWQGQLITLGLYALGGLSAAACYGLLARRPHGGGE